VGQVGHFFMGQVGHFEDALSNLPHSVKENVIYIFFEYSSFFFIVGEI